MKASLEVAATVKAFGPVVRLTNGKGEQEQEEEQEEEEERRGRRRSERKSKIKKFFFFFQFLLAFFLLSVFVGFSHPSKFSYL